MELLKEEEGNPRSEATLHTYGITIRPTLTRYVKAVAGDVNVLISYYEDLCMNNNLENLGYMVEDGNHLHGTFRARKGLNYAGMSCRGWHHLIKIKKGLDLQIWHDYINKGNFIDFNEYAFLPPNQPKNTHNTPSVPPQENK